MDNKPVNTPEEHGGVQAAIDVAAKNGGVVLLRGRYQCPALRLAPNVHLRLERGSVLQASASLEDYISLAEVDNGQNRGVGTPVQRKPAFVFLYAKDCANVKITGEGTIDANGGEFMYQVNPGYWTGYFYPRPTTVYFENCRDVEISGVTIINAPFWTIHPAGCVNVLIDKVKILNPLTWANSDGIDPDHCQNVKITNCVIECADDCICLKNTLGNSEYPHLRGVEVSGCSLRSSSAAIKIGTEGIADFEDILVHDCKVLQSNRGISIQLRDCGSIRNAVFRNIDIEARNHPKVFWGSGEPICVTLRPRDGATTVGKIHGLLLEDITCRGENGLLFYDHARRLPLEQYDRRHPIDGVTLRGVSLDIDEAALQDAQGYDLRPGLGEESLDIPRGEVVVA
ncbi:MAG: glycoside hydrolase family 28 protein [Clostridium sp.]|jgi:polygalacturonase|nr:glycoside hydrolase family 28 protein [Clostridium sp.]